MANCGVKACFYPGWRDGFCRIHFQEKRSEAELALFREYDGDEVVEERKPPRTGRRSWAPLILALIDLPIGGHLAYPCEDRDEVMEISRKLSGYVRNNTSTAKWEWEIIGEKKHGFYLEFTKLARKPHQLDESLIEKWKREADEMFRRTFYGS